MNLFYLGSALNLATIYMIAGSGSIFSIKSGNLNFGGEGQIYLGGFICATILNLFCNTQTNFFSSILIIILSIICAVIASGLLALISGVLKNYKNADFLFTSFLASSAAIPLIDGLITNSLNTKKSNLLATEFIKEEFRLKSIMPPSTLNITFFIAIIICVLFYFFYTKTYYGRKICIFGISKEFARYSIYNVKELTFTSAFISGAMHGLAGAAAIIGTYFTCHCGFYNGMGWSAFSAALLCKSNPLLLIPSSIFLAFITTYSNRFAMFNNFGFDISSLIQSIILLIIAFCLYKNKEGGAE